MTVPRDVPPPPEIAVRFGRRTYRRLNIERLEIRDLLAVMAGFPVATTGNQLPPSVILDRWRPDRRSFIVT